MTQEEQMLLLIKGAISDLSQEEQDDIRGIANIFRNMVKESHAMLAFALVGAELAVSA